MAHRSTGELKAQAGRDPHPETCRRALDGQGVHPVEMASRLAPGQREALEVRADPGALPVREAVRAVINIHVRKASNGCLVPQKARGRVLNCKGQSRVPLPLSVNDAPGLQTDGVGRLEVARGTSLADAVLLARRGGVDPVETPQGKPVPPLSDVHTHRWATVGRRIQGDHVPPKKLGNEFQ